jgi:hypothetical protein
MGNEQDNAGNQKPQQTVSQPSTDEVFPDGIVIEKMSVPVASTLPSALEPAEPPNQSPTPTPEPTPEPTPPPADSPE